MNFRKLLLSALIGAAATVSFAQQSRLSSRIDNTRTFKLPGRHPLADAANDRGEVEGSFTLPNITLALHPSAAQQASLRQLLQDQQNPKSGSYHQWLTPEQYADRFGVSVSDGAQIVSWLENQGFTVDPLSRSRTSVTFSGTAAQVQAAFGTTIHRYSVNGKSHFANSTDLTIPAALSPLVSSVRGLNDFKPKPKLVKAQAAKYTLGPGNHVLAPDDFATIYNINPLYSAGTNGTGQKIVVVGQSTISAADIKKFWNQFGVTGATLVTQQVPRQNPGLVQGDVDESALDLEWAGAVARNATIVFVYSNNVWDSARYAVENALAPVISMSYGNCEMYDLVDLPSYQQMVQQANAEGITWLAAAGDYGSADCDAGVSVAEGGLAVDAPGSIPEITAMGGTTLSNSNSFWNSSNTSTSGSAKGYIPEIAWNESDVAGQLLATGGGASLYFRSRPGRLMAVCLPTDGAISPIFPLTPASIPFLTTCIAVSARALWRRRVLSAEHRPPRRLWPEWSHC